MYSISENIIIINFAPFYEKIIQINDIVEISIIKYRPLKDYGGWGIRIKNNITAYTIGGNTGILILLKNKEQILIGSKFKIDLLECVFCGYCVEACPCDAIRMDTGIFSFTASKREDFVLDKKALMANERSKDLNNG